MSRILSLILVASLLLPCVTFAQPNKSKDANKLAERLKRLETEEPKDIADPPFGQRAFPSNLKPPQEIIRDSNNLPHNKVLLDKPDWQRPAYKSYWHSVSSGRWSYVPNRGEGAPQRFPAQSLELIEFDRILVGHLQNDVS